MTTVLPLSPAERRRLITLGLGRALGVTIALFALYYFAPLDRLTDVPFWLSLTLGLLLLTAVATYQVRAILGSHHPAIRGIEAVAVTVPLFLILFAATYFLVSQTDPANFSQAHADPNRHPLLHRDDLRHGRLR